MDLLSKLFSIIITALITAFSAIIPSEYDNPVDPHHGGDPFMVEDGDYCYYTYTMGNKIEIVKVNSFEDRTVIEQKVVYTSGNDGIKSQIWAPEIHKIGNRWYIISCALFNKDAVSRGTMPEAKEYTEHDDYYRYGFVLESETEDIFSNYTFKGILSPDGMNNIDGTYLKMNDKLYYVCSAYVDVAHQCIFISEMKNPYTLKEGSAEKLSEPEYYWETKGWKVNEGPAVLYNGDNIHIIYSASGYSSGGYCLGMLTFKGYDIMKADDWDKCPSKLTFNRTTKDIYNAGHCSFLYRENGEIFMIYHATTAKEFFKTPRITFIHKVKFFNDIPILM